jgi:hypothetical protein
MSVVGHFRQIKRGVAMSVIPPEADIETARVYFVTSDRRRAEGLKSTSPVLRLWIAASSLRTAPC